jgi:hypothetical protein
MRDGTGPRRSGSPHTSQEISGSCDLIAKAQPQRWNKPVSVEVLMEERDFFDERQETKKATMTCPHCHQSAEYELGWFVRTKKKQLPGRADERDRAKFAKARSYMVRRDDLVACKNLRCRKRFEVTSVQSVAFLE